jgi:hypothetical protein
MKQWLEKIILQICWMLIKEKCSKFKAWFLRYETLYAFWYIIVAIALAAFLYLTGCALLSNNIAECKKACGVGQMASFQDGDCICTN